MPDLGPSQKFLRYCAAVTLQRKEDDSFLERAIAEGRATRGSVRYPSAIFINGEGPMIDCVAVDRLKAAG